MVHYGSSQAEAVETAERLRDDHGVTTWTMQADLASPEAIAGLFARVEGECGRLDVLVNSAASFDSGPLEDFDAARWDRVMEVNLRAPHLCMRAARKLLSTGEADDASIINIGDLSGTETWRDFGAHGVSKAGLLHLTRSAALELAPAIRVNAVVPGAILPHPGQSSDSEAWRTVGERVPLGRPGTPEDIGDAVVFLAGAPFVTGEVLVVDGGEHLYGSTKR